jgi:hypothetical protein
MLTFLSDAGLIPEHLIKQAVHAIGEPQKLLDVRSMTAQIDAKTGATLAIHLYDLAYRPASQYFTHATNSALLRHVTPERRYSVRPTNPWVRRTPVRLVDACVGLLAGAIAVQAGDSKELFLQYSEDHARRVLPPFLVTVSKGISQKLSGSDLVRTLQQARAVKAYLSGAGRNDPQVQREARLRDLYETLITRMDLDLPPDVMQPIIDHLVSKVLSNWEAEAHVQGLTL